MAPLSTWRPEVFCRRAASFFRNRLLLVVGLANTELNNAVESKPFLHRNITQNRYVLTRQPSLNYFPTFLGKLCYKTLKTISVWGTNAELHNRLKIIIIADFVNSSANN